MPIAISQKGDLSIANNYRGITLTPAAKINSLLLLKKIRPEIQFYVKIKMVSVETSGQILTIRRVLEGIKQENLPATMLFNDFSKAFDSIVDI